MNDPDLQASIPYYPGYEPLWVGGGMSRARRSTRARSCNPIADGAEAYYTYETGDSVSFKSARTERSIQLRELTVRPRKPKWNLVRRVALVRHAARVSSSARRIGSPCRWTSGRSRTEDDPKSMDDVPVWVKPMITPMKAEISAIAVEYGLHEGRFWLPRLRMAEGNAQVSFMHVPVKMEESFKYASVNAKDSLPAINFRALDATQSPPDSLDARTHAARGATRCVPRRAYARARCDDSIRQGLKKRAIRASRSATRPTFARLDERRYDMATHDGDAHSVRHDRSSSTRPSCRRRSTIRAKSCSARRSWTRSKAEALSLARAGAVVSSSSAMLPPPTVAYGPSMMRYNRVEGLSFGASVEQQLGGGYSGAGDRPLRISPIVEPNVELSLARTNLTKTIRFTSAYNRLVSASDWGHPLSFGSSFSALMFGRDEGFYYRATGVELARHARPSFGGGAHDRVARASPSRSAPPRVKTNFAVNGGDFPANLVAQRGGVRGLRRAHRPTATGLDPHGFRVFSDLRLEARDTAIRCTVAPRST